MECIMYAFAKKKTVVLLLLRHIFQTMRISVV